MRRGPPVAYAEPWQVAQPDSHQEITWLEKSLINMSNLPKYYFHDLPAEIMDEIIQEMESMYPDPSWEEIDAWVNAHYGAATVADWYERAEQFISDQRRVTA